MGAGEKKRAELESAATLADLAPTQTAPPGAARTKIADRYEILGLLGIGGMGIVYKVRDHELDEVVALKMLSPDLAANADTLARFRREVRIARKVTHPHVARTFDIGEHDGARFLTMEYVDGEALDAKMARGRLGLHDVVRIVAALCEGLHAAHLAGVVHRDLKPANVLVANDRVVVTDFGIARALESCDARTTSIAGTPAYMAPEQVEGRELDARADLYALGVMLFEMLTGELPFVGDSPVVLAAARLLRPAPDVLARAPGTPLPIAALVRRLLEKDRDARPSDALSVKEAIVTTSLPSIVPAPPSLAPALPSPEHTKTVAVLPFSSDTEDDRYLAEAIAEEIADVLSTLPGLRVRPFGATKDAASHERDPRVVGERLGVHVVLEGSVKRRAGPPRVQLRLIGVADGFQIHADRFEGDGDPYARAAVAARAIAAALTEPMKTFVRERTADPIAQDLYLRARYLYRRMRNEASGRAVELLAEAHGRAPEDARIAALYAMAIDRARSFGPPAPGPTSVEIAQRALALGPDLPEAHLALATNELAQGRAIEGARHLARALALPARPPADAVAWRGELLAEVGPIPEAIRDLEEAMALEPELDRAKIFLARLFVLQGDRASRDDALREPPRNILDHGTFVLTLARIALWTSDPTLADRAEGDLARAKLRLGYVAEGVRRFVAATRGETGDVGMDELREKAREVLPPATNARMASFFEQLLAELYLGYGAHDDAERHAIEAERKGAIDILWFDGCPLLAALRGRPDFEAARERVRARAAEVRDVLLAADVARVAVG